jgi:hypothetical protein
MNPIQMFIRGYKIGVSNLGAAWLYLGAIFLLIVLVAAPVFVVAVLLAVSAASGPEALLEKALVNWPLYAGLAILLCAWWSIVMMGYFYFEAGLRGVVAQAHRQAPPGDLALKPKLGASASYRVFTFSLWWNEAKRHGWRVTLLATLYSTVMLVGLLIVIVPLLFALAGLASGSRGAGVWIGIGTFALLMAVFILAAIAAGLHYQVAVTWAVLYESRTMEAVRAATKLIKAKPLELLAILGLTMATSMVVVGVFMMVSLPLSLFSMLPPVALALLPIRFVLSLVQWWVQGVMQIAFFGAYTAYCLPLAAEPQATQAESEQAAAQETDGAPDAPNVSQEPVEPIEPSEGNRPLAGKV